MKNGLIPTADRHPAQASPILAASAAPVGVWRTYQTYADLPVREEPLVSPSPPSINSRPTLSACLIVRDEELHLRACLESIAPIADEIVVIDTGSRDRTKDIARQFQARIFDFPWTEDFGAARNEARRHARCDWILQVDADEILQPFPFQRLKEVLSAGDICAYYVLLRRSPHLTPNWQIKLVRNNARLQHQACVHESIPTPQLRGLTGQEIACFPILFEHSGYEGNQSHKHARYLPLLLKILETEPSHPDKAFIWGHLADIHEALGNPALAESARLQSLEILRNIDPVHPVYCALYLAHLKNLVTQGQDAAPLIGDVARRFPGNLQLHWLRGHWLIQQNDYQGAEECFEEILERGRARDFGFWVGYDRRLFGELSYRSLALCAKALGREQDIDRYSRLAKITRLEGAA